MTIYIVSTSHIAQESIKKIERAMKKVKPDCVAVELDWSRFIALKQKERGIKQKVALPLRQRIIFSLFQRLQDRLAQQTGIFAGAEMLKAVELAQKGKAKVAFMDRDIRITVARLMAQMSFLEKSKLFFYLLAALIGLPAGRISKKFLKLDLTKVPSEKFVAQAIAELKEQFPTIYRVLVLERDAHMARALATLSQHYKKILAVVGAGHAKGIAAQLKKLKKSKASL